MNPQIADLSTNPTHPYVSSNNIYTAVNAVVVTKPVIQVILPSISVILAL